MTQRKDHRSFLSVALLVATLLASVRVSAQGANDLYFLAGQMPAGRQMLGSAIVDDFLYVISGTEEGFGYSQTVNYSRIQQNGLIGDWFEASPLPRNRSYIGNCTFSIGRIIYIAGGNIHAEASGSGMGIAARNILMARANDDGSLSPWIASERFPGPPVQCNAAVHNGERVYVIGGANDNNQPLDVVYSAPLLPTGITGSWREEAPLPKTLWFHCAGRVGNQIFVWGGTEAPQVKNADTYVANIGADGRLSQWEFVDNLPFDISHAQGVAVDQFLISFLGIRGDGTPNESIFFSLIGNQKSPWQPMLAALPMSRYGSAAFEPRRNMVYLVGGRAGAFEQSGALVSDIYAFKVLRQGQTASQAEIAAAQAEVQAQAAQAAPAPAIAWYTLRDGLREAQRTNRNLLVVLGSSKIPAAIRFWQNVCMDPQFAQVAQQYVCAVVDVSQDPSSALQLGVFQLPAVVTISPRQGVMDTLMGNITLNQVMQLR